MVKLDINLSESIARQLERAWPNLTRSVMEAIAVEGYRTGALSQGQVAEMLGLSFWETEAFLKNRQAHLHYDSADLDRDRATLQRLASP